MRTVRSFIAPLLLSTMALQPGTAATQVVPAAPRDIQEELRTLGLDEKQLEAIRGIINRATAIQQQRQIAQPPSSWSVQLPSKERFVVLADFKEQAVLDRETGLVWEREPDSRRMSWYWALQYCYGIHVGGRMGWRLPAVEELSSLASWNQATPGLPGGHPFEVREEEYTLFFWSATTIAKQLNPFHAWGVSFLGPSPYVGATSDAGKHFEARAWCVRGGVGHDGATEAMPP